MAILKPRTRIVYFRISEEEFRELNAFCQVRGARSLSDLAREAMQNMLQRSPSASSADVTDRLMTLERAVAEMNQMLRSFCSGEDSGSNQESRSGV